MRGDATTALEPAIQITGLSAHDVHPMIADMAHYASDLAGKDPLPCRSRMRIDFARLDAMLDHMFLVDVVNGGADYYFKYFGETMHIMCGINLCGMRLSEVADPGMRSSFKASYDQVVAKHAPLYLKGHYSWPNSKIPIERLLIPIVDDSGAVTALCGLSVPGIPLAEIKRQAGKGPATLTGRDKILKAA